MCLFVQYFLSSIILMFHSFHWTLHKHWDELYLENDFFGIEVQYSGKKKKWHWYIHPIIDPNRHTIKYYAFDTHTQKTRFLEICKIQGIWWRSGYLIACLDEKKLTHAVEEFDVKYFTSIPGIGPKTAKRILLELKTSLDKEDVKKLSIDDNLLKNILTSLHDLGYQRKQVKEKLLQCPIDLQKDHLPEIMKRLVDNL